MDAAFVPVGQLSEESQEASNKFFKRARLMNSRTMSRKSNNKDIIHHLLITSDPLISNIRKTEVSKFKYMLQEASALLKKNETAS